MDVKREIVEFDKICRICIKECNVNEVYSIFGSTDIVPDLLMSFTSIKINKFDELPKQICGKCNMNIETVQCLKKLCEESDSALRNYVNNKNTDENVMNSKHEILEDPNNKPRSTNLIYDFHQTNKTTIVVPTSDVAEFKSKVAKEQKNSFNCKLCKETFGKKIFLKCHTETDHADDNGLEKTHKCIECLKFYSTFELLSQHMKLHANKLWTCDQCSKQYTRLDLYVEHMRRHSGERPFLCTKCGKGYFSQLYLDKHMHIHKNDHVEKPTYECNVCGKKMKHSNHLQVHMQTHKIRNTCENVDIIDKTIVDASLNKKMVLCSICGKSCSSRSNLAVHMRRHSGKMTNFCSICGKGYPRTTDLTLHLRQHTGERPFACTVCGRSFARSDKLAIHMRTHTGEKPYACSICGRAFAQSNDLTSHKKRNLCGQMTNVVQLSTVLPSTSIPQTHQLTNNTNYPITKNHGDGVPSNKLHCQSTFVTPPIQLPYANGVTVSNSVSYIQNFTNGGTF